MTDRADALAGRWRTVYAPRGNTWLDVALQHVERARRFWFDAWLRSFMTLPAAFN